MADWRYGEVLKRSDQMADRYLIDERVMFLAWRGVPERDGRGFIGLVLSNEANGVGRGVISKELWSRWWTRDA